MSCNGGFTSCSYGGGGQGGNANSKRSLQVVKDEWGGEKWVLKGYKNITQPDPQRQALSGTATVNPSGTPIMAYGSTPYVGMTPKKNGGHIQSAQMTRSKCPR